MIIDDKGLVISGRGRKFPGWKENFRRYFGERSKRAPEFKLIGLIWRLAKNLMKSTVDNRPVGRGIVDQNMRQKILEQQFRAANMKRIAMAEEQSMDAIHARRMQIWAKHAFVISFAAAIEQPIRAPRPHARPRRRQYRAPQFWFALFPASADARRNNVLPESCANQCTSARTSRASDQFALLKTIDSHGSNGAVKIDNSAIAKMKKAIGTTRRFANNEIGVTR